jgi:DNA adenine methylase
LSEQSTTLLVEPFAGGGTASLLAVLEGYAERAILIERDPCVAAVWKTLLSPDAEWLGDKLLCFKFNLRNVMRVLGDRPRSTRSFAFQTIVKNRARRGGILSDSAKLIKKGERGRGIKSRWYPETLALRIALIHSYRKHFTFIHADGLKKIVSMSRKVPCVRFFVDPPYPENRSSRSTRLYSYNTIDHEELFGLLATIRKDFLMTYNNSPFIRGLSEQSKFSTALIQMTNSHGLARYELLIRPARANTSQMSSTAK